MPQLKRIDDIELMPLIQFATDISSVLLPKSIHHCVPETMQGFLGRFIEEYYRLFDTRGRGELQSCYHDSCILSFCVAGNDSLLVPTRQYKYGQLIYHSRNFKKIDENKQMSLMRIGKTAVLDFLRVNFPITKHEGTSFHVDFLSSNNNRAMFCVSGLFREIEQGPNGPIRYFKRTFTCVERPTGVFIIADHIMLTNATDQQVLNLKASESAQTNTQQHPPQQDQNENDANKNQMIVQFSHESGMNFEYSKLCLIEYGWDYTKARQIFNELKIQNKIPAQAFVKT